jgi:hypothetical protein
VGSLSRSAALYPAVSKMNAWRKALLVGDLPQQFCQLVTFLRSQCRTQCLLVLVCGMTNFLQRFRPLFRELQRVLSPRKDHQRLVTRTAPRGTFAHGAALQQDENGSGCFYSRTRSGPWTAQHNGERHRTRPCRNGYQLAILEQAGDPQVDRGTARAWTPRQRGGHCEPGTLPCLGPRPVDHWSVHRSHGRISFVGML